MQLRGWLIVACSVGWLGCTHDFGAFQAGEPGATDAASDATDDGGASDGGATGEAGACGERGAVTFAGHCYFPLQGRQSWSSAGAACKAASAHLVTLGSSDEQNAVQAILALDDRWIGLDRPPGSATGTASFAWTTGEPRTYTNWGAGEPNGTGECARMKASSGQWADAPCFNALRAVCERD